jgi:hypothetical protein
MSVVTRFSQKDWGMAWSRLWTVLLKPPGTENSIDNFDPATHFREADSVFVRMHDDHIEMFNPSYNVMSANSAPQTLNCFFLSFFRF